MSITFDDTQCLLGEGPLWHPEREQLFWFDILSRRLLTREGAGTRHWQFDEHVSAAGWVDRTSLLIASETALFRFDIESGGHEHVVDLEAADPVTRSNDGRADPHGGFWIGTMGKNAEPGAGAIYRYYRDELRRLFAPLTITNAICFAPDGRTGYFTDTNDKRIMRVALDGDGWPEEEPSVLVDLSDTPHAPDGAVTDADGNLWNAQYGSGRVACYAPDGAFLREVAFPASQTTCPAFGGPDLGTLYCTSASDGLAPEELAEQPAHGRTFAVTGVGVGRPEPRVVL
ncbi:SMP-30/gluconolactonase/LRE family protein [Tranquillimonas alkanivorans]|uniref:Sugar lactone lactonase YvrE n=1 Tax=Tranquillimonas alkanivorans TaxID=441119 RepID=A0A1I5N0T7_9RHOB|nr:SMP-30/gluconolactonase/LRE family protein [Tranquillimonas alkanivorans]SFP15320.1 Sugar lactone lactonase YvrE [Tranquillimonas alkanivorans]